MLRGLFPRRGLVVEPVETRATRDDLMGGWQIVRGTDVPDFQRSGNEVRLGGWERHPVVNACVRAIVDVLAAVPLEVTRPAAAGAPVVVKDHPALALLQSPRSGLSPQRMLARTAMSFLIYGNAFWMLERRGRRGLPIGLRVVAPERVQYIWTNADDVVIAYDWRGLSGDLHPETPATDVVHFRDLEARDGLFGFPRAAAALLDIDADTRASQYVRQVLTNDGTPTLLFQADPAIGPEDGRRAEAQWNERQAARGERGNTRFVGGIAAVHKLGFNLSELEFPELRRIAREDICAVFGVDPRMVGIASAASDAGLSGEQYREARFRLIQQAVLPLMKAIEHECNYWLMPEFGDVSVRFSPEVLSEMTEDEAETSTRVLAEVTGGIRTVEEAREVVGLDADMDPSHTLMLGAVTPKQVRAALADAETTAAEQAEHAAKLAAPADETDDTDDAPAKEAP